MASEVTWQSNPPEKLLKERFHISTGFHPGQRTGWGKSLCYQLASLYYPHLTVVLPHGIRKLSGVQWRALLSKIEAGNVLLLSQFHPDAQWVVSRAMERNKVVTGLAQIVIVAESDMQGGTWAGARGALQQNRPIYVREPASSSSLPGNKALIELGGHPLPWPVEDLATVLSPLIQQSAALHQEKSAMPSRPGQLSLFASDD